MQRQQNIQHDSIVKVCDESLDSDGDEKIAAVDQSFGAEDQVLIGQFGAINMETEGDLVNMEEKPYNDTEQFVVNPQHQQLALEQQSNSVLS